MSLLADIRRAVADQIIDANLDSMINVYPYWPRDFALPAVIVMPSTGDYLLPHGSFGPNRMLTVNLVARVFVPTAGSPQSGDEFLDELLSTGTTETNSIPDAIEADGYTLGGTTMNVHIDSISSWTTGVLNGREDTDVTSADINMTIRLQRS